MKQEAQCLAEGVFQDGGVQMEGGAVTWLQVGEQVP